ncbi:TetR/AcrR family transcriptional regulator [Nocardioides sp. R-C-SC26]|uniref:TetR/AcrR family transcriptional regulator n=1 Tax=Nocardioides sp. R-C-SC26 TaxID=2870414 RepID=UPI001E3686BE|nr:TetR/AcrR family transcriptional regulator [Nocardioides sp. R-C-SC26]
MIRPVAARDRILRAAETCLRRDGIRRTTVAAVADEAGLSRAYVYRFFADKPTLLSAALIRRDEEFWLAARLRVAGAASIAEMIAEAVLLSRASPLGPLALELAEREPEAFAEVVGTYVHEVVPGLSDFWIRQLEEAAGRGLLRDELDIEVTAEWVVRIVVSLVGVPGRRVDVDDREELVEFLRTYVAPALEGQPRR